MHLSLSFLHIEPQLRLKRGGKHLKFTCNLFAQESETTYKRICPFNLSPSYQTEPKCWLSVCVLRKGLISRRDSLEQSCESPFKPSDYRENLPQSSKQKQGGDCTYMLSFLSIGRHPMQMTCSAIKLFSSSCNLTPATIPSQRETHFWYIVPDEVEDPSLLSQYRSLLSPCENQSVLRMQGDKLQKRAMLARALVRTTLARYTDSIVSPSLLKFTKNTYGKPEVEWQYDKKWDPPPLHFNLSHTSSLIACGVTINTPIGVDVEEKQRMTRNNISSLARRYFSSDEVEYLHAIPDPEIQRQEFIKLWTLKEAYVKALGRGFSATPFKTFTIRFGGIRRPYMQTPDNSNSEACKIVVDIPHCSKDLTSNWEFAIFELANSHYASICIESNSKGEENDALKLKVWKTLPFVKDEYLSETDCVRIISGLT